MLLLKGDRKIWLFWRLSIIIFNLLAAILYVSVFVWIEIRQQHKNNVTINSTLIEEINCERVTKQDNFGQWKYLTRWNHIIQAITFICALFPNYWFVRKNLCFTEVFSNGEPTVNEMTHFQTKFINIFNTCFHSLSVPIAFMVSFLYWTLRAINPTLVISKDPSRRSPFFVDQVVHTVITPFALIELIFAYHQRPKLKYSLTVTISFFVAYVTFAFSLGILKNIWIYGILETLNWSYRALFIIGCFLILLLFYAITVLIHKFFWSENRKNYFMSGVPQSDERDSPSIDTTHL